MRGIVPLYSITCMKKQDYEMVQTIDCIYIIHAKKVIFLARQKTYLLAMSVLKVGCKLSTAIELRRGLGIAFPASLRLSAIS